MAYNTKGVNRNPWTRSSQDVSNRPSRGMKSRRRGPMRNLSPMLTKGAGGSGSGIHISPPIGGGSSTDDQSIWDILEMFTPWGSGTGGDTSGGGNLWDTIFGMFSPFNTGGGGGGTGGTGTGDPGGAVPGGFGLGGGAGTSIPDWMLPGSMHGGGGGGHPGFDWTSIWDMLNPQNQGGGSVPPIGGGSDYQGGVNVLSPSFLDPPSDPSNLIPGYGPGPQVEGRGGARRAPFLSNTGPGKKTKY